MTGNVRRRRRVRGDQDGSAEVAYGVDEVIDGFSNDIFGAADECDDCVWCGFYALDEIGVEREAGPVPSRADDHGFPSLVVFRRPVLGRQLLIDDLWAELSAAASGLRQRFAQVSGVIRQEACGYAGSL